MIESSIEKGLYDWYEDDLDKLNPYQSFRPGQKEVIKKILNAFESDKRFVILQLPTGTGKSVIAYIVSKIMGTSYFITSSKMLQDQYARDFHDLAVVKGRANFDCLVNNSTCADGWCTNNKGEYPIEKNCIEKNGNLCTLCRRSCTNIKKSKENCEHKPILVFEDFDLVDHFTTSGEEYCPYWEQKCNAIMSDSTIMNNWYYIPELNFIPQFQPRNLLIVDEAHNASEILIDNVGLSFELDKIQLITGNTSIIDDFTDVRSNVITYYKKFKKLSDFLVDYISEQENHLGEKELQILKSSLSNCFIIMNWLKEDKSLREWIFQLDEETSKLKVLPLNASRFAEDYLFSHCDKVLLMSATLDYEMTLKELGIKPEEATFISMPSTFPKENCKIYTSYVGKFTGDPSNYLTNDFLDRLELILAKHRDDKGIIHCVSYNIMDFILEYVSTGRDKLIGHNQRVPAKNKKWYRVNNKNEMLESFIKSDKGVFVSPSSYEGLDLANEDVQFQVHCKVPYLNLGDKRIEKKSKQDSKWYAYRASLIMTQGIGRGVRSETDTCTNYILDSSFDRLVQMGVVSDYIKDRILK